MGALLTNPGFGPPEQLSEELIEAYEQIVLSAELVLAGQSVVRVGVC